MVSRSFCAFTGQPKSKVPAIEKKILFFMLLPSSVWIILFKYFLFSSCSHVNGILLLFFLLQLFLFGFFHFKDGAQLQLGLFHQRAVRGFVNNRFQRKFGIELISKRHVVIRQQQKRAGYPVAVGGLLVNELEQGFL